MDEGARLETGVPADARAVRRHRARADGRPGRRRRTAVGRRPGPAGGHGGRGVRVAVWPAFHRRVQNATGAGHVPDVRTAQGPRVVLARLHRVAAGVRIERGVLHRRRRRCRGTSARRAGRQGGRPPGRHHGHVRADRVGNVVGRLSALLRHVRRHIHVRGVQMGVDDRQHPCRVHKPGLW